MDTSQKMFLMAVEDMNFTKAAKRAFVTQQCLSAHIGKLEKTYGTKLFERRPHLALTASGKILYDSLIQIKNMEDNMIRMISSKEQDICGEIHVGIPTARAAIILPDLLESFHEQYPNVKIQITLASSNTLSEQLLEGKLDIFVGVNSRPHPEFSQIPVTDDEIYLAAGKKLLAQYLPEMPLGERLIRPEQISRLPLIMNPSASTVKQLVEHFLVSHRIVPNDIVSVDHYMTAAELCRKNVAAFFCPESILLNEIFRKSYPDERTNEICILKVEGLTDKARIELITNRNRYLPSYVAPFGELLLQQYQNKMKELRSHLS